MPNQQNIESVDSITSKFQAAAGIYFTDYLGLNVRDITELRRKFTANAVEFRVIKNTLAKLSAEKAGLEDLNNVFDGPTAVALSYDDPTVPARIIKEFNKMGFPLRNIFLRFRTNQKCPFIPERSRYQDLPVQIWI